MSNEPRPNEPSVPPDEAGRRPGEHEEGEPIEGDVYAASSSESGGNYDSAGPTAANIEGEPMDEEDPAPS